ncbi:TetR/AcrR family transcriptional regulator [Nocardioides marmoriginsengisoli]|uniref:TetR/AcrR family transcriptional regulator n=1 Tax=Nocardioides marmoriginsengisoli TaxID=661483 RepID=A0A3N0CIE8_9ACTN|nr:TetR/AcrR family transcriptional regulator [Nocardioides marmoriginsengisoli]RNL63222.1 TetR/AcrR family transcriptional regulator [Nocardioides marmoriginsengisoli]
MNAATPAKARTARQRAREEITAEILLAARARLAEAGPGELSLRAVARDVGMVSSAVYRYFPSRDDLLTALLISAYDELGVAAEAADDAVPDRDDPAARWTATCTAVREWAIAHPHDYALLYGSPVSGYAAPQDTIVPATRVIVRLVQIIVAAHEAGIPAPVAPVGAPAGFDAAVAGAREAIARFGLGSDADAPAELVGRTLMAWTTIFGTISFELWGHLVGSVEDHAIYYSGVVARLWDDLSG